MDKINEYYEEYNYPSAPRIYKLMKKDNIKITLQQIKDFLSKQTQEQVMKKQVEKHDGHITANFPDEFWQIDIFDLSKYKNYNKGYRYIFCAIDIFTRKAYATAMKSKDELEVLQAFSNIISKNVVMPVNILSDSDSSFLSHKFTSFLKTHDINHDTVPIGDHASLGVIDRFALTLKTILSKRREAYGSANWKDVLNKVITTYNNTEHRSLLDLTPNEADKKENRELILRLNVEKSKSNVITSDLQEGDKVRIKEKDIFKKGSEAQWSSKIYTVKSARGKSIYLTTGEKKKRNMLLKVDKDTQEKESITKRITREARVERLINQAGVQEENIVRQKRASKAPQRLNL